MTLGKKKPDPITEDLKCVELEFRTIDDKMEFKAAYDALRRLAELDGFRRKNRPRPREVKLLSNYQPPKEQGSLTRTYESAAVDTENLIPTAAPKGTNTDTRLFYKPKAEVWPSMGPLPSSQRALAGHSSTRFRERPDNLAFVAGRLDPIIELDNRKWGSNVSDDGQLESITPSNDKAIRGVDPHLRLRGQEVIPCVSANGLEACGDQRWTDASEYLARKCQALVNENTTDGHEYGNATSQSARSAASRSQIGTVVPGSFPSDTAQLNGDTSSICSTTQASHTQNTYNPNSKDLYVLFCVYQKSQILHSQILATKCQNDQVFFENLRLEFRRLRGFFRFWFSPLQFSHCDFVRFTRFYVNELAKVGLSLPNDLIYEYNPRPPGPHDDPPISPHEFRRRFHTPLGNPCGRSEALERIPKRQKRFQINLHVDGREDMWGLLVELQPCFLVVLVWQIAITGGGWAFMGWWLSKHHGDLQDAAMPITLIITALMALWVPIGKGMRETL
ncbi:hypothetical protein JMJ35_001112 [Cladonia borealis]|uniref:Uncharacterized protein n=1 Tax=Cladonia borealis TaxID=184061 RepID=A0AA39V7J3_9LECA|nr:hypothetical protein JMJ35_001112 [Cladonia borealis]